ncbi:MAG: AAA family ATPase, partial [Myxococcales bacterium]|nr:AAA family ATPase [Myxococcales bacterium]
MHTLEKITIRGFKSIRDQTLHLRALNLFIGANGAGKSNLIEVLQFLREIASQNLGIYTERKGGPDTILHFGRATTPQLQIILHFSEGDIVNGYAVGLEASEQNKFFFVREEASYHERQRYERPYELTIASAAESRLRDNTHICARQIRKHLEGYRIYHFHDTSSTAAMKQLCDVDDNRFLRAKAENLPAYLYFLQQKHPTHFAVIESTIRQIAPFFDRFTLAPSRMNEARIQLEWKERGRETSFKASALSDGTLRFICLATLLLQPELPPMIILDEPELGLHPAAITVLAGMLDAAATRTQVIAATQSVT